MPPSCASVWDRTARLLLIRCGFMSVFQNLSVRYRQSLNGLKLQLEVCIRHTAHHKRRTRAREFDDRLEQVLQNRRQSSADPLPLDADWLDANQPRVQSRPGELAPDR